MEAKWLDLELTESLTLDDSEATIKVMRDLKRIRGWPFTGRLRHWLVVVILSSGDSRSHRIKIDRSFMRDVATKPAAAAVVSGILSLGRNLGLECVAEGVETQQQLDYLKKTKVRRDAVDFCTVLRCQARNAAYFCSAQGNLQSRASRNRPMIVFIPENRSLKLVS